MENIDEPQKEKSLKLGKKDVCTLKKTLLENVDVPKRKKFEIKLKRLVYLKENAFEKDFCT